MVHENMFPKDIIFGQNFLKKKEKKNNKKTNGSLKMTELFLKCR